MRISGSIGRCACGCGTSLEGRPSDAVWASRACAMRWKAAPCSNAKQWQPYLDLIRRRIASGSWDGNVAVRALTPAAVPAQSADLAGQLAQLAELHRSGALSSGEYERAKARVLSET
jgi:hypothetical protein